MRNIRKETGRILWKVVTGEPNPVRGVKRLPKRNDAYAETWRRRTGEGVAPLEQSSGQAGNARQAGEAEKSLASRT